MQNKNTLPSISDWSAFYGNKVSASENKELNVNKWYPILEGFSSDFVQIILNEQETLPDICLDPFAGGGTTPLTCQNNSVKCYSFEVSPFMSQVCRSKLYKDYNVATFKKLVKKIELNVKESKHEFNIVQKTMLNNGKLKKWLFHEESYTALLDIRHTIDKVCPPAYKDLFYTILSSILLKYSNVTRDGKALRYKKKWSELNFSKEVVLVDFIKQCNETVAPDILKIVEMSNNSTMNNYEHFYEGDCRDLVEKEVKDETVDLVITSPPYLNSRDYTDSHMVELWMLGHISSYDQLKKHRRKTLRSHVQVKWDETPIPNSPILAKAFEEILLHKEEFWNKSIPDMITGYFQDMQFLLKELKKKLKKSGKIYINVANSAYYGVIIETDKIIAELAQELGYRVQDIRLARRIKTSSQQFEEIKWLRESVIVLENL